MREFTKGDVLVLPVKVVTQYMICRYADAAEDHNPLHVDPEFAKTSRYGGTIAHGMLTTAFLQELMVRNFGLAWLENGKIEVNFMAPVRPGDRIVAEAKVANVVLTDDGTKKAHVQMRLFCSKENQEKVIKGQARVTVSL